jgi:MFS family permease
MRERSSAALLMLRPALVVLLVTADPFLIGLALPDVMNGLGVRAEQLNRGTAVLSVYLVGAAVGVWTTGRTRVHLGGWWPAPTLLGFALASAVAGSVHRLAPFLVARGLQGLAAGALVPVVWRAVDDARRALVALAACAVPALGPLLGIFLLSAWSWRAVCWTEAILALALAWRWWHTRGVSEAAGADIGRPNRQVIAAGAVAGLAATGLAALVVYVPLFTRTTRDPHSASEAGAISLRGLFGFAVVAVAVLMLRPTATRRLIVVGLLLAVGGLCGLSFWNGTTLRGIGCWFELIAVGAGLGLVCLPLAAWCGGAARAAGAALLGAGLGLAALTADGLIVFHDRMRHVLDPEDLCPTAPAQCAEYEHAAREAVLDQLRAVFVGAALCVAAAAVIAALLLRAPRRVPA